MRTTEPLQYLPFINARRPRLLPELSPIDVVECSSCTNTFQIAFGVAFEVICKDERMIGLWCSYECFLRVIPCENCARA